MIWGPNYLSCRMEVGCSVSINQRYVISLETNLTRKDASNDVLELLLELF